MEKRCLSLVLTIVLGFLNIFNNWRIQRVLAVYNEIRENTLNSVFLRNNQSIDFLGILKRMMRENIWNLLWNRQISL